MRSVLWGRVEACGLRRHPPACTPRAALPYERRPCRLLLVAALLQASWNAMLKGGSALREVEKAYLH